MKRALSLGVVLAVVAGAATSHADSPDQKAAAQALFEKGRDLVQQGNFGEACPKFAESLRLDPGVGTMLWLADCYENNGQTASAWAQFKEAASVAALAKDPRESVARKRIGDLEPKLSFLTILWPVASSVPGLEVRRDGIAVSPSEKIPVDPGIHAIAATAPGRKPWTANVDVASGRTEPLIVNVPVLEAVAPVAAAPAAVVADTAPPGEDAPPSRGSSWSTVRIVGASAAVAGVVALGIGSALGLGAKSALDDSNKDGHCLADNECDAAGKQSRNDARGLATGATIGFVAGGVLLVGGAVLFFTAPSQRSAERTADKKTGLVVVPSVSSKEAGLIVFRRF